MFTRICFFVLCTLVGANLAFGQAQNCGDGNQRYDAADGPVIRYFTSINEFDIVRESENQVTITDSVDCRYGTDTLVDIETIEFLDQSVTISELVIHENTKDLSVEVLTKLLFDAVLAQVSALGVDPFAVKETVEVSETVSSESTTVTTGSTGTSGTGFSPTTSSFSFSGNNNTNSFVRPTNTFNYSSNYGGSSYNPYGYNNYSPYNSQGQYYDAFSNTAFSSQGGFSSPTTAGSNSVIATWPLSSVSNNEIVYFEAVDGAGKHHFLGSAMAYQGSDVLTIPDFLADENRLTIHIKVGSRLVKTFVVE